MRLQGDLPIPAILELAFSDRKSQSIPIDGQFTRAPNVDGPERGAVASNPQIAEPSCAAVTGVSVQPGVLTSVP
jgi:hypothetical protein